MLNLVASEMELAEKLVESIPHQQSRDGLEELIRCRYPAAQCNKGEITEFTYEPSLPGFCLLSILIIVLRCVHKPGK
jgi:hypothetical protein